MTQDQVFEIEIKSLLGSKDNVDRLLKRMKNLDPNLKLSSSHSQLNHYFEGGDLERLVVEVSKMIDPKDINQLKRISNAKDYSLRTRLAGGQVIFVLKISRDDATSANSTNRIEFESKISSLTIDDLDKIILNVGFHYQAKWSRERSSYKFLDTTVTLDKNAGYGYLAEFEIVERDPEKIEASKARLKKNMSDLKVEELDQARLERMFKFYNTHWEEYYGTDKVFVVE